MKKYLLFWFMLFETVAFGYQYDALLIKAQAEIFPKLILLDSDLGQKVKNNEIVFCIVCHESDKLKSQALGDTVVQKFGNTLDPYRLRVVVKQFEEIVFDDDATAYYLLKGESEQIARISKIAQTKKAITFVYDMVDLKNQALITMVIAHESIIYLNKDALNFYKINFMDFFYQIVRLLDE